MSSLPDHLTASLIVTVLILLTLAHYTLGAKPVELAVTPKIAFAPATIQLRVRVHAVPTDRWVVVQLDSGDFFRSSQWDADPSRTLYSYALPDVPAGEYEVTGAIGSGNQIRASDRQTVLITAP